MGFGYSQMPVDSINITKSTTFELQKDAAESELLKNMDSISEVFKKFEPLRKQGMSEYVKNFDEKDRQLMYSTFMIHEQIFFPTVDAMPKEIRDYIQKGRTSAIPEVLRLYAAQGNMLAGDYLALAGAEKSDKKKKDLLKIYMELSSKLFEFEASSQRYLGINSRKS